MSIRNHDNIRGIQGNHGAGVLKVCCAILNPKIVRRLFDLVEYIQCALTRLMGASKVLWFVWSDNCVFEVMN